MVLASAAAAAVGVCVCVCVCYSVCMLLRMCCPYVPVCVRVLSSVPPYLGTVLCIVVELAETGNKRSTPADLRVSDTPYAASTARARARVCVRVACVCVLWPQPSRLPLLNQSIVGTVALTLGPSVRVCVCVCVCFPANGSAIPVRLSLEAGAVLCTRYERTQDTSLPPSLRHTTTNGFNVVVTRTLKRLW